MKNPEDEPSRMKQKDDRKTDGKLLVLRLVPETKHTQNTPQAAAEESQ
jgi:hypothetical protein